jgi:hypothetical protein
VQAQDERLSQWLERVDALAESLRQLAATPPVVPETGERQPQLSLVRAKPARAESAAEAAGGTA